LAYLLALYSFGWKLLSAFELSTRTERRDREKERRKSMAQKARERPVERKGERGFHRAKEGGGGTQPNTPPLSEKQQRLSLPTPELGEEKRSRKETEMSWQQYVDDHLMVELPHGGTLLSAAIVGHDGGVWASSPGFPDVTPEEVDALMAGLADAGPLAMKGMFIGGAKYMVIPGDPGAVLRGKKGAEGVTVKKTETALVVGLYGAGAQPGEANVVVENLGDYLIGQGI
jgi:profilin